jgi:hypothetical protein
MVSSCLQPATSSYIQPCVHSLYYIHHTIRHKRLALREFFGYLPLQLNIDFFQDGEIPGEFRSVEDFGVKNSDRTRDMG